VIAVSVQAEFCCFSKIFFLQKIVQPAASAEETRSRGAEVWPKVKPAERQTLAACGRLIPGGY